ncbi:ribose/galactose ABC transporter permease [Spiroplasma turonicum]|uniref:Ribose/galactose ABC transporter permease n=2 Tax=Spiroplasma turonicum TaxID=216946 RepID=A0A0K1P6Y8_9MOLU|nr:ribose/galactose ABC transporter permease [Spiroplasma turonicum]
MFTILIIQSIADKNGITFGEVNKINVILVFICFILMGTIISALSGLLKVFFNIHEVATTILLNYVTYFLLKWVININGDHWGNTSPGLNYNWLSLFGIVWLLPVLLVILSGTCISLILYFTKWGFRYKAVGSSPTASKYAGINEKLYILIITIAQGILMSMGGFIYYFGVAYSQSIQTDNIPTLGYDAIAIALIAFNNFLGIPFVSFLWAIFQVGFKAAQSTPQFVNLSNQTSTLVFGLITYSAAIYIIFYKIEFIRWINDNIIKYNDIYLRKLIKDKKIILKNYKTNQKDLFKKKSDTTLHDLHLLSKKIKTIKSEISDLKINSLNEYKNNSILAIKSLYKQNNNKINNDFFENLLKIKNSSSLNKKDNKKLYKETLLKNYNELIKNYKKTKNNNFKSYKEALTQLKTYIKTYQINIFKKNILKLDKKNDNYKKMIEDEKIKFFDLKKEVFNKYAW